MLKEKIDFDVNNPEHLKVFKRFLDKKGWGAGGCPFKLVYPWLSVPDMIQSQITKEFLKNI